MPSAPSSGRTSIKQPARPEYPCERHAWMVYLRGSITEAPRPPTKKLKAASGFLHGVHLRGSHAYCDRHAGVKAEQTAAVHPPAVAWQIRQTLEDSADGSWITVCDSNRTMFSTTDVSTFTPACRSQYAWEPLRCTPWRNPMQPSISWWVDAALP